MDIGAGKNSVNSDLKLFRDEKSKTSTTPPPGSSANNFPGQSLRSARENRETSDGVVGGDSKGRMSGPQIQAQIYLNEKKIFELFNFLIGHLLVDEPTDPIEYLADLLDKCMLFRAGLRDPPLLFTARHVESMFQSLDPGGLGSISLDQYKAGMTTLGIGCYEMNPKTCGVGRVDKPTFEREAGGGGRGVRPVYLRCSRGAVSWRYPRGALRVVLLGGGGRSFRGCVKVSGPARVYLEAKGTLRPVYAPGDGKHEALHRCFHSRGPVAALYVEADEPTAGPSKVKLQYDLEFSHLVDDEGECRPCSKEELDEAYCRSDLVARGMVRAVERRPDLDAAELVLRVTKMLRRVDETDDNEVDFSDVHRKEIRIRVPSSCDARHGQGEFVIMAKKRLGDLTLVCAPRLEAWAEAVREIQTASCVLKS